MEKSKERRPGKDWAPNAGAGGLGGRRAGVLLLLLASMASGLAAQSSTPPARSQDLPRPAPQGEGAEKGGAGEELSPSQIAPPDPMRRPRIREVLRYECDSDLAHHDVVLFDDRTVRVKDVVKRPGAGEESGQRQLLLHELTPDEYRAFLNRLELEKVPEPGDLTTRGPGGTWVELCRLVLELPGQTREEYRFRRYDALSLALSRRVAIAEEIGELAEETSKLSGLPRGYKGRPGDLLERRDGVLFEIVRETGDEGGWELRGIDQPLTVFIPKGALRQEFVRLVSRRLR